MHNTLHRRDKTETITPAGPLGKDLLPENKKKEKEKQTQTTQTPESKRLGETKLHSQNDWENNYPPMVNTMEGTKKSTGEGRLRSPPSRRSTAYVFGNKQRK